MKGRGRASVLRWGPPVLGGILGAGVLGLFFAEIRWNSPSASSHLRQQLIVEARKHQLEKKVQEKALWGKQMDWWRARQVNPETGEMDLDAMLRAREEVARRLEQVRQQASLRSVVQDWAWESLGPINIGGRVRALLVDRTNPNRIYAGAASGGLWVSEDGGMTWRLVRGIDNLNISALAQDPQTGVIYVGTGEYFGTFGSEINSMVFKGNSGMAGKGIYYSVTPDSFAHLPSTLPLPGVFAQRWTFVNDLEFQPDGSKLFAGTFVGLMISTDGGQSWTPVNHPLLANRVIDDIEVVHENLMFVASTGRVFVSTDGGNSFTEITGNIGYNPGAVSRIRITSSGSTIYIGLVDNHSIGFRGGFYGIYRSDDGGTTWSLFTAGSMGTTNANPTLEPCCILNSQDPTTRLHCQCFYNWVLEAHPTDPDLLLMGGITLWRYTPDRGWHRPTSDYLWGLHVDHHAIAFDPTNPSTVYLGNDGGVWKSTNAGELFSSINKGFVTTQFYGFDVHPRTGWVAGGTQDNGSMIVMYEFGKPSFAWRMLGGDGTHFWFVSNRGVMFGGVTGRFPFRAHLDFIFSWTPVLDQFLDPDGDGSPGDAPDDVQFIHPFAVWEDTTSNFYQDVAYVTLLISLNSVGPGDSVLFCDTPKGLCVIADSILLEGPRVLMAIPMGDGLFISNTIAEGSVSPMWIKVAGGNYRFTNAVEFTSDGDCLFFAVANGVFTASTLYRMCGFRTAKIGAWDNCSIGTCPNGEGDCAFCSVDTAWAGLTSLQAIATFNRVIVGIHSDPINPNILLLTGGGYGGSAPHVYLSTNAKAPSPVFTPIDGDLPNMPVYDAVNVPGNTDTVLVGTEYGVWMTTNASAGSPTWIPAYQGMGTPLVVMLDVIPKPPEGSYPSYAIFAATHGRGFFVTGVSLAELEQPPLGVEGTDPASSPPQFGLTIFPNPVREGEPVRIAIPARPFKSREYHVAWIQILSLEGRVVYAERVGMAGNTTAPVWLPELERGMYIVRLEIPEWNFRASGYLLRK